MAMIQLYQFPRAFGLPNASPFCMKLEGFLRLAKLDYELVKNVNPRATPEGKLPCIKDGGKLLADSSMIVNHLTETHDLQLDVGLSSAEKARGLAAQRLLEDHLYWALIYSRWLEPANGPALIEAFFLGFPALVRPLIFKFARKLVKKQLLGHGMGRHQPAEIYALGAADIHALADLIGEGPYFHGGQVHAIDTTILAFVANILVGGEASPLLEVAAGRANLVAYRDRMMQLVFPDFPVQ